MALKASAFGPTSGIRDQESEDSRAGDFRGGASSAGMRLWVGLQADIRGQETEARGQSRRRFPGRRIERRVA
ncbi:MAG TPA: hypothetical protein PLM09_13395, partial [Casimicrobiaceae bacterium]|nr:hypothetical protein [Casimicrobiaceae bacterium]